MLDSRARSSLEDICDASDRDGCVDRSSGGGGSNITVFPRKVNRRTPCAFPGLVHGRSALIVHDDDVAGGAGFAEMKLPTTDGSWQTLLGKVLRIPEPGEASPAPGVDKLWLGEVAAAPWSKVGIHDHQRGRKRYSPKVFVLEDERGRTVVDAEGPDAKWEAGDLAHAIDNVLTEFGLTRGCARRFLICDNGQWLIRSDRGAIVDVDRAVDAGFWYLSQDRPQFADLPMDLQDAVGGPLSKIAWALSAHRYLEVRQLETSEAVAERRVEEIARLAASDPARAARYLLSLTSSALDRGVSHGSFMSAVQAADIVNRDARAATSGANTEKTKAKEQRLAILTRVYSWLGPDAAALPDLAVARLVHAAYDNDEAVTKGLDLKREDPQRPTETAKDVAIVRQRLEAARAT